MKENTLKQYWMFLGILFLVFLISSLYTFNEKLDLNGDNCYYYIYAKSLATGKGYSNLLSPGESPANNFPPGYSLLMVPLMLLTDSIVAQNFFGELFLLGSSILVFLMLIRLDFNKYLSLLVSILILTNEYNLKFATMMMSEMPFAFFCLFTMYHLLKEDLESPFHKSKHFWFAIIGAVAAFHIRTQGIVLLVAVLSHYLFSFQWKRLIASTISIVALSLPWILRNKMLGLASSRYTDQIFLANSWNPEAGKITTSQLIGNAFTYFWNMLDSALPESIFCFLGVDEETTKGYLIIGILMLAIMVYGCWQLKKLRFFLLVYMFAGFAIVALWNSNSPGWNRHLICFLPLLIFIFYYGLISLVQNFIFKKAINNTVSIISCVLMFMITFNALKPLHEQNKESFPIQYDNFISMCEDIKTTYNDSTIFCVRKPELFYVYSGKKSVNYIYSLKQEEVIKNLVDSKVDFVILDQLGFSSTGKYLYPAIQKYAALFTPVYETSEPKFYLLKFDKAKAMSIH